MSLSISAYLLGLVFFSCLPFGLLPIIILGYNYSNHKDKKIFCALLAIFFGIAGYWFINPATDPDLVRYLDILGMYKDKNLFESFNLFYNNLFSVDIYFHIISKLGDEQFLPAISVFLFYFIVFYILKDYKERTNISNNDFIIYTVFVITAINFCSIVNGIRWPLTCAIFLLAFYREIIQGKNNLFTWILYIISLFFHFSTLVYFIIRLALSIRNKKITLLIGTTAFLTPNIIGVISNLLSGISTGFAPLNQIIYFFNRANMYFKWEGGEWADIVRTSTYYKLESIYYYLIVTCFIFVLFYIFKKNKKEGNLGEKSKWKREEIFVFYMLIITIISFTMSAHTYIRFVTPLIVCFCIISFRFQIVFENTLAKTVVNICFLVFSGIGIFLNLYLLSSMMKLPQYMQNIFTTGILQKIAEILF